MYEVSKGMVQTVTPSSPAGYVEAIYGALCFAFGGASPVAPKGSVREKPRSQLLGVLACFVRSGVMYSTVGLGVVVDR